MRAAHANKSLHSHPNSGVHGHCEADLGHREQEGDYVGEGVEGVECGELRQGENKVGEDDAEGVGQEKKTEEILEYWLQVQVFMLQQCQG